MRRTLAALAPLVALAACRPAPDAEATPYEGDAAGECGDGADNDRDGYFDCEDNGCWNAPECGGGSDGSDGSDGGAGDGTDGADGTDGTDGADGTDGTSGEALAGHLTALSVAYTLTWDFDDEYASLLEFYGLADCVSTYAASGDQVSAEGPRVTFHGPWRLTGSTCSDSLQEAVWWDTSTEESYATVTVSSDLSTLESWVQHRDEGAWEPGPSPADNGQWYITEMGAPFDGNAAAHEESEVTLIEGLIPLTLVHEVRFGLAR